MLFGGNNKKSDTKMFIIEIVFDWCYYVGDSKIYKYWRKNLW